MLVVSPLLARKVKYYSERPLFKYIFNISEYVSLDSI
jgi:hypothetical protein